MNEALDAHDENGPAHTRGPVPVEATVDAGPANRAEAELFRTLGHPARLRILELLQDGPRPVREILADVDLESSNLSQQLAVLRRAGLVTSSRDGSSVVYTLGTPDVGRLLHSSRRLLATLSP